MPSNPTDLYVPLGEYLVTFEYLCVTEHEQHVLWTHDLSVHDTVLLLLLLLSLRYSRSTTVISSIPARADEQEISIYYGTGPISRILLHSDLQEEPEDLLNDIAMGKICLQETSYGNCLRAGYIPICNDELAGGSGLRARVHQ